ncbi:ExbD/TolR family protein [Roseomonas sp. CECT 9278]|uniref:ExbD/TolR family protein n=1 Tax=Roseomonas sp. CECT 9278 TaxID=2845823 RepID=UPI001E3F0BE0|nr:ExbD/TolR family protein [Roseomonas sp. CECT 9278]CAH0299240.1 Biopolymer transport protein ExbD [Roseomonas sp. CECT 9278]
MAIGGPGGQDEVLAEINVTPFVDVMLVLLIIFMVAAPMMSVGVPVDLPRASNAPAAQAPEPLVLSLDSQGRVFIEREEVGLAALAQALRPLAAAAPDRAVFLRADRAQPYGEVMRVLGAVSAAGFARASLIGEAAP